MLAYYLILFTTGFLILYAYRAVHIVTKTYSKIPRRILRISFLVIAVFVYASTSYLAVNRDTYQENKALMDYTLIGAITLNITLLVISVFQLIADLVLLFRYLVFRYSQKEVVSGGNEMTRRIFVNKMALALGGVVLGAFLWGTTKGKYGWKIFKNRLSFSNLPASFDGMKIVQISDLHLGSFNENFEPLEEAVQMINELEPDYIFFTGDLVNEKYTEAEPWIHVIKKLRAKKEKYAILGNHDYGWGDKLTPEEKAYNSKGVSKINEKMGFTMLLNEHTILENNGDKIGLIGVENWGYSKEGWFPTVGDFQKSVQDMEEVPFKILLSHDPTHWDHKILGKENVDLTLAGHTHGGQVGVSIPGLFDFSVGRLFYDRYAGLYKEGNQHLYVNRGLGFLIFPGRVGVPPEITLHVLNKA